MELINIDFYDYFRKKRIHLEISENGILIDNFAILEKDIKMIFLEHKPGTPNLHIFEILFKENSTKIIVDDIVENITITNNKKSKHIKISIYSLLFQTFKNKYSKNIIKNIYAIIEKKGVYNINDCINFTSNGIYIREFNKYIDYKNLNFSIQNGNFIFINTEEHSRNLKTYQVNIIELNNFMFIEELLSIVLIKNPIGNISFNFSDSEKLTKKMSFADSKYSVFIHYFLCIFFGWLGLHRLYVGNIKESYLAVAILATAASLNRPIYFCLVILEILIIKNQNFTNNHYLLNKNNKIFGKVFLILLAESILAPIVFKYLFIV